MTAEEVDAALKAEGLTLVPARNSSSRTGYKCVVECGSRYGFTAPSGLDESVRFDTPEEAALVYARSLGVEGSKAEAEKKGPAAVGGVGGKRHRPSRRRPASEMAGKRQRGGGGL